VFERVAPSKAAVLSSIANEAELWRVDGIFRGSLAPVDKWRCREYSGLVCVLPLEGSGVCVARASVPRARCISGLLAFLLDSDTSFHDVSFKKNTRCNRAALPSLHRPTVPPSRKESEPCSLARLSNRRRWERMGEASRKSISRV
jgi:hypothetical protein